MRRLLAVVLAALATVACSSSPTEPPSPTPTPLPTFAVPTYPPTPTPGGPQSFRVQGGCADGQPTWLVTNLGATMLAGGQWAITAYNGVVTETGGFQLTTNQQVVISARLHVLSGGQWSLVLIYLDYASVTLQECVPSTPTSTPTWTPTSVPTAASTPTPTSVATATPTPVGQPTPCAPFSPCGPTPTPTPRVTVTPTPDPCGPGPGGGCAKSVPWRVG